MTAITRNPTSDESVAGLTWTGSAGTRFQSVDDHPDSAGTDSLTLGPDAAGGNITFGYTAFDVPVGATINAVRVHYYDLKNGTNVVTVGGRIKVNGSYHNAASHNATNATWVLRTDEWLTNPGTSSAWTVDDVNGSGANPLQAFGLFSTDATPSVGLASIQVEVDYTAGSTYTLTANQGSYSLIGSAALLDLSVTAEQGSYALSGQNAALYRGFGIVAGQGSYSLTGQQAGIVWSGESRYARRSARAGGGMLIFC